MEARMAKHNKKRNVGLLHEQLVRHASEMTVEGMKKKTSQTVNILMKHYSKESELLKEFRLFSSLIHTNVESKEVAKRIIDESRKACENHDPVALMKEKSALIKDVNHLIGRKDFYNQRVKNYKLFTTVQTLLNEWRGKTSLSPEERVRYELVLEAHQTNTQDKPHLQKAENANPLVLNIMIEKFNKKYESSLDRGQKELLESALSGDDDLVIEKSNKIKQRASDALKAFYSSCDNSVLNSKKALLEQRLKNYQPDKTDKSISQALILSDLLKELEDKDV